MRKNKVVYTVMYFWYGSKTVDIRNTYKKLEDAEKVAAQFARASASNGLDMLLIDVSASAGTPTWVVKEKVDNDGTYIDIVKVKVVKNELI